MVNWVWVVGGGRIQEPLIREFCRRGYDVVIGDRDFGCHCAHLGHVIKADTYDSSQQLLACRYTESLRETSPKAVMTAGTDATEAVAAIAEYYHLPGISWEVAHRTRTKHLMREATRYPHPWFVAGPHPQTKGFPCVVKPVDSNASHGITLCQDPDSSELGEAIERARAANRFSDIVLIEEYLHPHEEASTDWFVENGHVYYVNGAYRSFESDTFGLETGWVNPFPINGEIAALAHTATAALGVKEGPFKMDIINDERYGWTILECTTRWSGSFDHTLGALYATGRNLSATLADFALGKPFHPKVLTYTTGACVGCYAPPVKLSRIPPDLLDTLREHPHVLEAIVTGAPGGPSLADRPLFILARGNSVATAKSHAQEAWQGWVEYERTMNLGGGDH